MDITFDSKKHEKIFNSIKKMRAQYGARMAEVIAERMLDLDSVEDLSGMEGLPGRFHELTGNLKGYYALDLVHPNRLLFKPFADPPPKLPSGAVDLSEIRNIVIVGIIDYH